MPNLTDLKIKKLQPKEKIYRLSDGNNLYIEVKPNGLKFWRFRYKIKGKSTMLSLGKYPEISVKKARQLAYENKIKLINKTDPMQSKKESMPFCDVCKVFFRFKKQGLSERYFKGQVRLVENYLFPSLKNKGINDIQKSDILKIYEQMPSKKLKYDTKSKGKSETIRKLHILLREILRYAVHNDFAIKNIADQIDMNQVVKKQKVEHFKAELDIDKLRSIYKLINDYDSITTKLAMKFIILTALRVGNVRNLQWDFIDFDKKIIIFPAKMMKNREEYRLPITSKMIDILDEIKKITKDRKYVFCSPIAPSRQMSDNTINFALKRMDLNITAHGFRSSFSTICYESQPLHNHSFEIIETQLSHKVGNKIVRSYLRSDFLEERRALLTWWGDFLDQ